MDDGKAKTQTLGFRGEALGSLSDIYIVEIRMRARGMPNAYYKIIKGSRCSFLGIDDDKESVGTSVTSRDLFYNQPVRRKLMLSSPQKVLHSVKKCVLRIALVHTPVSFRVTDTDSEEELLRTSSCSSPLLLVAKMFGDEVSSSLNEIAFYDQMMMLSGYVSGPADCFSSKNWDLLLTFFERAIKHLWQDLSANSYQEDSIYVRSGLPKETVLHNQAKTYADKVPRTISGKKRRLNQLDEHCNYVPGISKHEIALQANIVSQYQDSPKKHLQRDSLVGELWATDSGNTSQVFGCRNDMKSALSSYDSVNGHVHMKHDTEWMNKVTVGSGTFDDSELAQGFSPYFHAYKTKSQSIEFTRPSVEYLSKSSCYLKDKKTCNSRNFLMSIKYSPEVDQRRKIFFPSGDIDCARSDDSVEGSTFENIFSHEVVDTSWSSCNIMRRCQSAGSPEFSSPVNSFSFWQACSPDESMLDTGLKYEKISFKSEKQSWLSPYSLFASISDVGCFEKKRTSDEYLSPVKCMRFMNHDRRKNGYFCSTSENYPSVSFKSTTDLDYSNFNLLDVPINHSSERLTSRSINPYRNFDYNIFWFCSDTSDITKASRDTKNKFLPRENDGMDILNVWCEQEFPACRLPKISLSRSRRSHSAPPFYRGKCKFNLKPFQTTVADPRHNYPASKLPGTTHLRDDLSQDDLLHLIHHSHALSPYAS